MPDPPYQPGRISYEWIKATGPQYQTCDAWTYEKDLETFLSRDPGKFGSPEDNLMILLGGIGTGKSTVLRRSLTAIQARNRTCSKVQDGSKICKERPPTIVLDFKGIRQGESQAAAENRFWNIVSTRINDEIQKRPNAEEEVKTFWPWCLKKPHLLDYCSELHRFFSKAELRISALEAGVNYVNWPTEKLLEALLSERDELFNEMSEESLAWYRVFMLAYDLSSRSHSCNCAYLVLENVDHVDPSLQKKAVTFAILLCDILRTRTVIAVRPLTYERSLHGEVLVDVRSHFGPRLADVIKARIDLCLKNEKVSDYAKQALISLNTTFSNSESNESRLQSLLRITSGISVRYALRNLYNMLQSPSVAIAYNKPLFISGMTVNEMARAFFFSNENAMLMHAFENLYLTDGASGKERWLIKPRILDFLRRIRRGACQTSEIFSFMLKFNHQEEVVRSALTEMMARTRPLIWSADGLEAGGADSKAIIMLTPVGGNYYDELFGEMFYEEVCLAKNVRSPVSIPQVIGFHNDLTLVDLTEIKYAVGKHGSIFYKTAYPDGTPSLMFVHWDKLVRGLNNIKQVYAGATEFDESRDVWLRAQVRSITEEIVPSAT